MRWVRPVQVVFALALVVYLVLGFVLALRYHFLMGDALSRVQSAQGALFSRDPHLAEIGFIFTPLTSLVELPLVALSPWIPELTRYGLAGVIMSAMFMAAAVAQIWGIAADRGTPRWQQVAVTALFAVNPMILFYGATGMSEAPFIFLMCWATRRLIRWTSTDDVHDLISVGVALGLGYLTRYDAAVAIAAAAVFVAVVTRRRATHADPSSARSHSRRSALLDAVIVVAPGALSVSVWAATSWLLTGQLFAQFESGYGNAQILAQSGGPTESGLPALGFSAASILVLAPAMPLLVPAVAALAIRRRDVEVLVPTLLFGSVLAFQAYSYVTGVTFPFLRFYICVIPLVAVYALQFSPVRGTLQSRRPGAYSAPRDERQSRMPVVALVAVLALAVSIPVTVVAMGNRHLSVQQYALGVLFGAGENDPVEQAKQRAIVDTFATERQIADYLDAMNLPEGSVLMDTVYGFSIVAASKNPKQFVVPSDKDFVGALNDPAGHGVRYIMAIPTEGRGASDAVNRRYPTIFDNGGTVASLDLEIPNTGADQPTWRMYRVLGEPAGQ
ncbi:glycosyltransferase family 39 protein [Rhodococcus spelaei]|uniref:Glycosyltransferase family 39 protein n=1 Tax=Rhodococcus spelaei TaxID=2546320 RepID=A0A541BA80_9NOCA|nr:glycosyltransferase family 39 protein [Rhodococcus spelaei]TQF69227.1 glycosyltransferase family 39 protein [Rhodococcus spelaei]